MRDSAKPQINGLLPKGLLLSAPNAQKILSVNSACEICKVGQIELKIPGK
jgi:hypothetical protein